MFSDATLVALSRFVNLPDGEFWMNLGDWPHSKTKNHKNENHLFQMVSWGSHADFSDLVVPTYDLMDSTLGKVNLVNKKCGECDQLVVHLDLAKYSSSVAKLKARSGASRQNISFFNF